MKAIQVKAPGYPLLEDLQKEGNIKKREDGRYELTERGKQELDWPWGMQKKQPLSVEESMAEIAGYVSYLEDLNATDKSKITPNIEKLKSIKARIAALTDSDITINQK